MRFLHFADLHLGTEAYGRLDPATGLSSRLGDFGAVLDEVVDYAIEQAVDLVVFAGDAFKVRDPNPTHLREFARRIRRLCDAGIPVFMVVGNHDLPNADSRAHTTEIFDTLGIPGVTVAREIGTHCIETKSGPVQIVALPWLTRAGVLSHEEVAGRTIEQMNALVVDRICAAVTAELNALDLTVPAILVGHCMVEGAVFGSERGVMLGQDVVLPLSLLADPRVGYTALGHIHKWQLLPAEARQGHVVYSGAETKTGRGPVVYSGSLERIDFGEEKEPKGFMDVTTEPGWAAGRFVEVHARRFLTIDVTVSQGDPTAQVLAAIAEQDVAGAVVRVQVHNGTDLPLDESAIRQALRDASFIASVAQDARARTRRALSGATAEGLSPRDALSAYFEAKAMPPDRGALMLACADALLETLAQGVTR
jgi:exonuclease SbcD